MYVIFCSTIKTVTKKPEEEVKRELSPELAKISALVTRPPKPKSTSKKAEEGLIDMNPAFAPDNSFSTNLSSVSTATVPRAQKTLFKALPPREPEPPVSQYQPYTPITKPIEPFYYVSIRTNGFLYILLHFISFQFCLVHLNLIKLIFLQ